MGRRLRFIPSDFLALAVVILVLISMYIANRQAANSYTENLRLKTAETIALSSANLEADITENLKLVEGLGTAIALEPGIRKQRFDLLASKLLGGQSALKSLAIARDLKIEMVYPFLENKAAIGLDYNKHPEQKMAIKRAFLTRHAVVDGPISLVQGGTALLIYYPLYDGKNADPWGILSASIDLGLLFSDRTITADHPGLDIAVGKDVGDEGPVPPFFGELATFQSQPVTQTISLANAQWIFAATPTIGWKEPFRDSLPRHLLIETIGFIIIVAVLGIAFLMRERNSIIASLRHREAELKRLSRRMQLALDASRIGIWEMNLQTHEVIWDDRMYALYGARPDCGKAAVDIWPERLHPDDLLEENRKMELRFAAGTEFRDTFRILLEDGEIRHIQVFGDFYRDLDGHIDVIGVNWDVSDDIRLQEDLKRANIEAQQKNTALEDAQKVLRHNFLHDTLTDLANRQYLESAFVKNSEKTPLDPPYAVLQIDLDRFKEINDTMGHLAGDAMLRHASRMLQSIIRPQDFLARVGGDEFALVTHWDGDASSLSQLAQEIIRALGKPLRFGVHKIRSSASVGVAWMDDEALAMRDVLVNANIALDEAKRMGRNQFVMFDTALRNIAITNKQVADELLVALDTNQFKVFYQPQICARTLALCGAEALVRWQHPTRGILAPAHFIGTAETIGAIARIDAVVMQKAAAQFRLWHDLGIGVPHISVNISAQRLADKTLLQSISEIDLEPGTLCFELLESISFDDQGKTLEESVKSIKQLGIDIEIDDFGTGYASIVSLLALAPKRLKIDRQLIQPITTGQGKRLVASIVEIGKALGIEVIAEGVETIEHAQILRNLGVDALQGYLFSPPIPAEDFTRFAKEKSWLEGWEEG